jgi:5-formyltetrahydrofolate cyclo-ligase
MDPSAREAIMTWRREMRRSLLAARLAMPVEARVAASAAIGRHLEERLGNLTGRTVSAYWPLRGEPDLRPWLRTLCERGIACALPVVVEKRAPLRFRAWQPGTRMEKGFWDIPVPAEGPWVTPDVLIAPVVGYDEHCFRLGYGGGYFDRTLAALPLPWRAIGVGYEAARQDSIRPLPHDIALHGVVTEVRYLERS